MFGSITAIILTLNEAPNIERVLAKLGGIDEIYVIDSGSTDDTAVICARFSNVKFIVNPFASHEAQWRFAIARMQADAQADGRQPKEWVLTLDADYVLSDCLIQEIKALTPSETIAGYACAFQFWIDAGPVPASLYPPRVVLFRPTHAHYYMRGHTQLLKLNGTQSALKGLIYHDDRKSWARFLSNQRKYAVLEATHLRRAAWSELRIQDKVRLTGLIAPWLVPVVTYMRIWPAGRRAIKYCAMRFTSEFGIAKTLWRMRFAEFFR
jgi:glycosyltransferase involved in cell wall biosynthesis